MAITKEQLPENIWENIENLMTLLEIGTGSETQDEFLKLGVQAIGYILDEAKIINNDFKSEYQQSKDQMVAFVNSLVWNAKLRCKIESYIIMADQAVY